MRLKLCSLLKKSVRIRYDVGKDDNEVNIASEEMGIECYFFGFLYHTYSHLCIWKNRECVGISDLLYVGILSCCF